MFVSLMNQKASWNKVALITEILRFFSVKILLPNECLVLKSFDPSVYLYFSIGH